MDEEEDLDIAAAMGFSSFGGSKKRKHDQTDPPQAKPGASGANTTELGVRTKRAAADGVDMVDAEHDASPSVPSPKSEQKPQAATGLADFLARAQTLPEKPPNQDDVDSGYTDRQLKSDTDMRSFGGPSISKAELNTLCYGIKNQHGDSVFFLPNFVDDPWKNIKGGN